jgi:hypothetical protein
MFIAMDGDFLDAYVPDAAPTLNPHVPRGKRRSRRLAFDFDRGRRLPEKMDGDRRMIVARDFDVIETV